MLSIIGLGLDIGDISLKGLNSIREADRVLIETYTLPIPAGYIELLEKETGKKITKTDRKALEDDVRATAAPAAEYDLALLVPGDPLVATTHHIIIEAAMDAGAEVRIIHSASIFTAAIGESGLDIYRFGPTTTIPFWSSKYKPVSFIDTIAKNLCNNNHTLVLLDVDAQAGLTMSYADAVALLLKAEEMRRKKVLGAKKILIMCEIGTPEQFIVYSEIGDIKLERLEKRMSSKRTVLIIPAELNFAEARLVRSFEL